MRGPLASLMVASLFVASLLASGCGGQRIVDGGVVDGEDWPMRPAGQRLRCPGDTFLVDSMTDSGRRIVLCRSHQSQNPRGFELTWDPNGQLISHLELTATGAPVGRKQWHDDGALASEETYDDGRLIRKVGYYQNGKLRADIVYDPQRDVTRVKRLAPDGSIEEQGEMRDGKLIGTWKEWREGALETLRYVEGIAQGEVERLYPDGGLERGRYEDGQRAGKWVRHDDRENPVAEVTYVAGRRDGPYRTFHPNTQMREEGRYVDDVKNGEWKSWYPSGELASEVWFACAIPTGPYRTYHPDGSPHVVGAYETGRKVGEWKTFNTDGLARSIQQYDAASAPFDPKTVPGSCESAGQDATGK